MMKLKPAFIGTFVGASLLLAVAPAASAHDRHGFFVFGLAAAVVNTAVAVATVPFAIIAGATAPRYSYYPPPAPYYTPPPAYYGPPVTYRYGPPPVYYAPPPTYYPPPPPPGYYPQRW